MLDLESEVNQRAGFNPGFVFYFHVVKSVMSITASLPMSCVSENPELVRHWTTEPVIISRKAHYKDIYRVTTEIVLRVHILKVNLFEGS